MADEKAEQRGRPRKPDAARHTFTWKARPDELKEWEEAASSLALPFQTWVKATLTQEARRLKAGRKRK